MIIEIHDVWAKAVSKHRAFLITAIQQGIAKEISATNPTPLMLKVQAFITGNYADILDSSDKNYPTIIHNFNLAFPPGSLDLVPAKLMLGKIFDYKKFRDERTTWGGYELCKAALYRVCPYCHLRPTDTYPKDNNFSGYRPQIDHVLSQKEYPYLALSLGNFIPSCSTCNGPGMKHTKNFHVMPHLNPLKDKAVMTFRLRVAKHVNKDPLVMAMRESKEAYELDIDCPNFLPAQNSYKTFQLLPQYQNYLHDAYRIAKRCKRNSAFVRSVKAVIGLSLKLSDELGFSPQGDEYKNIPQGKMRRDIYLHSQEKDFLK